MNTANLVPIALLCLLQLGCTHQVAPTPASTLIAVQTEPADQSDEASIYQQFLNGWNDGGMKKLNVSISADALTPEEIKDISDCAKGESNWTPTKPISNLTEMIGGLAYVHLVNPNKWQPTDPQDLISRGRSVESAVEDGFAGGLMSLSAITFDKSHQTAALTYSFVCGGLCGNGSAVIFNKTQSGWTRAKNNCGGWISQYEGRPNNSFKPTPLRGAA